MVPAAASAIYVVIISYQMHVHYNSTIQYGIRIQLKFTASKSAEELGQFCSTAILSSVLLTTRRFHYAPGRTKIHFVCDYLLVGRPTLGSPV